MRNLTPLNLTPFTFMQFLSNNRQTLEDLPSLASEWNLDRYLPWNHDCLFELDFTKSQVEALGEESCHLLPYRVTIEGVIKPTSNVLPVFEIAAAHAHELSQFGEYNVFSFGSSFERRGAKQTKNQASTVKIHTNMGEAKIDFIHRGEEGEPLSEAAVMAKEILISSPVVVSSTIQANWWAVRSKLPSVNNEAFQLLHGMVQTLGSGQVYEHSWSASIMGVHEEDVNKHGFELYNRVTQSGLTADKIQVTFMLQFLDIRGLEVVRRLCEGETNYTVPIGNFRHRKKKAILGVFTNKDGHRLSLTLKDSPTEEEWQHLETTLTTTFERKPFA